MVNGKGPFDFFLDTGAGATVVNADFAAELKLPVTGTTRIGDPANPQAIKAKTAIMKTLTIGDAVFTDVEVVTWERSNLYQEGAPRGVIGNPLWAHLLLTLDIGKGEARFTRGEVAPGPDVVEYEPSEGGIFRILITVGDLNMVAAIDSGSPSGLALPKRYAEQVPWRRRWQRSPAAAPRTANTRSTPRLSTRPCASAATRSRARWSRSTRPSTARTSGRRSSAGW